jgi:hypothetical protein
MVSLALISNLGTAGGGGIVIFSLVQPTLLLRSETEGICPDSEEGFDRLRENVRSSPEMGSVVARQVRARALRTGTLQWSNADESERYKLLKAYDDARGSVIPMLYTPVGDVDVDAIPVQFVRGSLRTTQTALNSYEMSVDIEEVL